MFQHLLQGRGPGHTMMESFENKVNQALNKARDGAGKCAHGAFSNAQNEATNSTSESETSGNDSSENELCITTNGDGFPPISINKKQVDVKHARQVFVEMPNREMNAKDSVTASITLGNNNTHSENSGTKVWSNLFKENRAPNEGLSLEFNENAVGNCSIEASDLSSKNTWGPTLIGYVAGRFPGRKAIEQCYQSWGVPCKFTIHESGWLIFRFKHENELNLVLEQGPFFIFQRSLLLKIMPPFFKFDNDEITQVPVWVRLPCLPSELWNASSLGKILSNIGKPIRTDALTATCERLSYARALVETNITKELPNEVPVKLPNGCIYNQRVVFEFVPHFCHNCKAIGHIDSNCRINVNRKARQPGKALIPAAAAANATAHTAAAAATEHQLSMHSNNQQAAAASKLHQIAPVQPVPAAIAPIQPANTAQATQLQPTIHASKHQQPAAASSSKHKARMTDNVSTAAHNNRFQAFSNESEIPETNHKESDNESSNDDDNENDEESSEDKPIKHLVSSKLHRVTKLTRRKGKSKQ